MSDERITWHKEWRAAREAALEMWVWHVVNNETMERFDASYEYADGHECVIYYHKARALFDDSSEVRDHEDHVRMTNDSQWLAESSIDDRIQQCVFWALRSAFDEAIGELEELDVPDDDELLEMFPKDSLETWAWHAGREALSMEAKA